ncbi:MAG: YitT family protein [Firmicutes bacterium]|nr:YitT family protein [Bacillota bacterium]
MTFKHIAKEYILPYFAITIGAVAAAFALEEFLIPSTILDGGITGISIILNQLTGKGISIFVIILNLPFVLLGFKQLGWRFLLRGAYGMILFSFFLELFKDVPEITSTELLAVVFGGVLLGVGVGIVLRYGGCLDGTEIVALLLSKKTQFSCRANYFRHQHSNLRGSRHTVRLGQSTIQSAYIFHYLQGHRHG